MADPPPLTPQQSHALLDILSHHEVYAEILDFRYPGALSTYGPPFPAPPSTPSTSPSLQRLVSNFILPLPGLRDAPPSFWQTRCGCIIDAFAAASLSESYDKGHVGIRKTLATAVSALVEYPARGVFAGFEPPAQPDNPRTDYALGDAADLQAAFRDFMHRAVYGGLVDEVFAKAAETDRLADHAPLVQAAHEFGLVNLASFLHYALILSPRGQSLLTLIDHANKLVPYTIIKQTLKIGNVASMISAMMKVVLAKMSVASLTNWIGWTSKEDDGMNLLQQIIYQVLHWDIRDLRSRASKIEKDKRKPSPEQLKALKEYPQKTREEHEAIREKSRIEGKSIALTIFDQALAPTSLSTAQHQLSLDYLAAQLSIRDREQIIRVLCKSHPDHLTQAVRDLVSAYEPVIRAVHDAVDLTETVTDFERFLRDLIKLSKLRGGAKPAPSVGDYVQLLRKHQSSSHRFLHQVAKNGPTVTSWFHEYALHAVAQFRRADPTPSGAEGGATSGATSASAGAGAGTAGGAGAGAGDLTAPLTALFTALPPSQQAALLPALDAHAAYLSTLHAASHARLAAVLASCPTASTPRTSTPRSASPVPDPAVSDASALPPPPSSPSTASSSAAATSAAVDADPGPGAYLARWQSLVDAAALTPGPSATAEGDEEEEEEEEEGDETFEEARETLDRPPAGGAAVVEALGGEFRALLGRRGCEW